jgi:N-acetylmuramoyl-L-alanine amidase
VNNFRPIAKAFHEYSIPEVLMKKRTQIAWVYFITAAVLLTGFFLSNNARNLDEFSRAAVSYYGSSGQEVINIQKRLKAWGYYNGVVDGKYGYQTYQAVRYFQSKNNLRVDGIAGKATLYALGLPTGTPSTTNRDLDLMAHIIYGEARGEPYEGQVAVGAVVLNRVADSRFPNSVAGVVYQPGAFDAVVDGQINLTPNTTAYNAARDALNGWDPSYGCIYYYNPATATSKWIWSRPIIVKIGKHNFAK